MKIDLNMPISELMHGESDQVTTIYYIDLDEDEMMHWKYIKREKLPNGKYRYYYDQSELDRYKEEAVKKSYKAYVDEDAYAESKAAYEKANKKATNQYGQIALTKEVLDAGKKYTEAMKRHSLSSREAQLAVHNYKAKKIKTFAARTISKGIVAIANLFSGLFN